jgi:DNA-binding SARP family transcriptional activator
MLLDGQPLAFPTRKALALLIYLTVEGGPHSREQLAALFWPESDSERGRATLRRTLSYVRDVLTPTPDPSPVGTSPHRGGEFVIADRDSLSFNFDSDFALDLTQVEAASHGETDSMRRAALAYRGDFLEGFSLDDAPAFDDWASVQREIQHRRMTQVFDRLSRLQAEGGERAAAIETASRWARHDSLNEAAHRRVMELHFAGGDRTAALQAYEACREILSRELNVEPAPETQALAERLRTAQLPLSHRENGSGGEGERPKPASPFIGRQTEHAHLARLYHEVRRYQTRLAALEGEPGIGKTRLAQEFLNWAKAQGAEVLGGRAFETSGRLPYQPLVEALRASNLQLLTSNLQSVWLAELARLLPELHDLNPDLPPPLTLNEGESKGRLFEAVVRWVQALADRSPVILFVDDVQWADAASLDLLHYAARRWSAANLPILLLFTLRAEDVGADTSLAQWLFGLGRELALARLGLGPLSAEDARQLAEALGGADGQGVAAATGGHPLFIIETVRAGEAVPASVRDLIRSRLARLTSTALTACMAASVIGGQVEFEALCRVADLGEREGLSALDDLTSRGLLRDANGRCAFTHDQIREVAYAEAGETRRRVFHRRALDALSSAPAAELIRHAVAANLPDRVFDLSLAAGEAALRLFAVRDAITHFERALTIQATPHLYSQLGRAHELTNAPDKARESYEALLKLAREGKEASSECLALNRLAALTVYDLSNLSAAEALLQEALKVAEKSGDRASLADTELNLAQLGIYRTDVAWMQTHGERALTLARDLDSSELLARALNQLAFAETVWGQLATAILHADEARGLYAALGNRAMEADSLCLFSDACVRFGELERGLAAARAADAISNEIENAWGQANSAIRLGLGLLEGGAYDEALKTARAGADAARRNNIPQLLALNLVVVGGVYRALSAVDEARAAHEEILQLATAMHYAYFEEMAASELCADCAAVGDWEGAAAHARRALTLRDPNVIAFPAFSRWAETEALCRSGEVESAAKDVQRFGELSEGNRRYRVVYLRALAVLAQVRGDVEGMKAHLREAVAIAESIGLPGELRRLYEMLGETDHAAKIAQ